VVGFVALAALPALGLGVYAAADAGAGETSGPNGTWPRHPELTDAQKKCLADNGVTLPQRPVSGATGQRPSPPTDEQRAAFRAAAAACGLRSANRPHLTDAQKQCLADHGVTLPPRAANGGARPAPPTADQRAALAQAAAACGIAIPEHGPPAPGTAQGTAV
jgi:hypothetical protein